MGKGVVTIRVLPYLCFRLAIKTISETGHEETRNHLYVRLCVSHWRRGAEENEALDGMVGEVCTEDAQRFGLGPDADRYQYLRDVLLANFTEPQSYWEPSTGQS